MCTTRVERKKKKRKKGSMNKSLNADISFNCYSNKINAQWVGIKEEN